MNEKYLMRKIEEAKANETFEEREKEKELAPLHMKKSAADMLSARVEKLMLKDENIRKNTIIEEYNSWDWVITKSYYAMYHSVLALLARLGVRTKTHFITLVAFELFFVKKNMVNEKYLGIFNKVKESAKIPGAYLDEIKEVKEKRFAANYDVEASIKEKEAEVCIMYAENFIKEMGKVFAMLEEA